MKMALVIIGVLVGICYLWSKYQQVAWHQGAEAIYMAKFEELKKMSFSDLLSRVGKAHDEEEKVVKGHQFLVGWRVDEPGAMGAYVNDKAPAKSTSKPLSDIDELEVNGYVDFIYPIPFTRFVHYGWSINFFKKKNGDIRVVFPKQDSGPGQNSGQ